MNAERGRLFWYEGHWCDVMQMPVLAPIESVVVPHWPEVVVRPAALDDAVMALVQAARAMFLDADDVSLDELEARINFVGGAIKALDALEGEG